MHEAAEDEHGVVGIESRRGRPGLEAPVVAPVAGLRAERAERLGPGILAVHDREDFHGAILRPAARRDPVYVEQSPQLPGVRRGLRDAPQWVFRILRGRVVIEEGVGLFGLAGELAQ